MSIEFPVRMGTSSMCIGRAVRTSRAYVGTGHAKKFIPYLYNAYCTYVGHLVCPYDVVCIRRTSHM